MCLTNNAAMGVESTRSVQVVVGGGRGEGVPASLSTRAGVLCSLPRICLFVDELLMFISETKIKCPSTLLAAFREGKNRKGVRARLGSCDCRRRVLMILQAQG
jgi:hypothetical protein